MGYSGGTTPDPTYTSLGDHSECIQIDYDPTQVTYAELLRIFWDSHDPTTPSSCRQYRSAIFYHGETQRRLAEESKRAQEALHGTIHTEIAEAKTFYRAEDYHQKWYLRAKSVPMRDFNALYPDADDFTDSTAAARVNGLFGRHYTPARLEDEIQGFGLSAEANAVLRAFVQQ